MTTPTVTVTVGGVPITATTTSLPTTGTDKETLEKGLHMLYAQATKGEERRQYVLLPPAVEALGVQKGRLYNGAGDRFFYLYRTQSFKGNRSKWFSGFMYSEHGQTLASTLTTLSESGWEIGGVVVAPLELDDYLKFYNEGETSHKALRAVDRALTAIGLSIKEY